MLQNRRDFLRNSVAAALGVMASPNTALKAVVGEYAGNMSDIAGFQLKLGKIFQRVEEVPSGIEKAKGGLKKIIRESFSTTDTALAEVLRARESGDFRLLSEEMTQQFRKHANILKKYSAVEVEQSESVQAALVKEMCDAGWTLQPGSIVPWYGKWQDESAYTEQRLFDIFLQHALDCRQELHARGTYYLGQEIASNSGLDPIADGEEIIAKARAQLKRIINKQRMKLPEEIRNVLDQADQDHWQKRMDSLLPIVSFYRLSTEEAQAYDPDSSYMRDALELASQFATRDILMLMPYESISDEDLENYERVACLWRELDTEDDREYAVIVLPFHVERIESLVSDQIRSFKDDLFPNDHVQPRSDSLPNRWEDRIASYTPPESDTARRAGR